MAPPTSRETRPEPEGSAPFWKHPQLQRVLIATTLFLLAWGVGTAWGSWQNLCTDCPSIAQIFTWEPEQTSKLFDADGRLIAELGYERRTPVSIDALPEHVPQAFIAIEDRRFYEHSGYDLRGIARAAVNAVIYRGFSQGGGSTLTQQLARNMFQQRIGYEKRIERKLKELQVALDLERAYSKDQILEAYINQVNYAHGWWGIQTAATNYFGKNASELNPAEGALLAAVVNRPSYYSPLRNPENARQRRNLVLDQMVDQGYLSAAEGERWKDWPIPEGRAPGTEGEAPYFEEWVRQILDDRFGSEVYTGGLQVYTTLDSDMQRAAQQAMEQGWREVEERPQFEHPRYEEFLDREEGFPGGITPYLQGVFVALDPETGAVRALIGGRDFRHSKFNRATQARRQPGSAFKPFVYTSAINSGIPASHIVVDRPVVLPQLMGDEWKPRNFTGEFHGPLTIREALYRSINIPAIRLAWEEIGMETVAQTARRMGIQTPIERFPSTAIGAAEVIPIEMAEAYSTFATLGTKVRPHPIRRVENARGEVLWEPQPDRTQVVDSMVARISVDMLQDVVRRGTGYTALRIRAGLPAELPAAGKTGTTNEGTNVWFAGVTPNLVGLVWLGMDRPQPIWETPSGAQAATGGADAAPIWGRFMKRVYYGEEESDSAEAEETVALVSQTLEDDNSAEAIYGGVEEWSGPLLEIPEPWADPQGLITRRVDRRTGLLASRWCPDSLAYVEMYIPGTEPTRPCDRQSSTLFEEDDPLSSPPDDGLPPPSDEALPPSGDPREQ